MPTMMALCVVQTPPWVRCVDCRELKGSVTATGERREAQQRQDWEILRKREGERNRGIDRQRERERERNREIDR